MGRMVGRGGVFNIPTVIPSSIARGLYSGKGGVPISQLLYRPPLRVAYIVLGWCANIPTGFNNTAQGCGTPLPWVR
jgi:hypothetical protein